MSNKPTNNISDFFRESFEKQSQDDLGWNNPPEFIFEEAINSVNNARNRKRRIIFFFSLAALVLAGVLSTQYYISTKLETIENKLNHFSVNENSDKISKTSTLIPDQTKTINSSKSSSGLILNTERETTSISHTMTEKATQTKRNLSAFADQGNNDSKSPRNLTTKKVSTSSALSFSNKTSTATRSSIGRLPSLKSSEEYGLIGHTASEIALNKKPHVTMDIPKKHMRKSILSLRLERNFSALKMTGSLGKSNMDLYDKYYSGIGIFVDHESPLSNKLGLINTLGYSKIANESLTENTYGYDKNYEVLMNNGTASYDMSGTVESPLGSLEESMQLFVDPLVTRQGDEVLQSVSLEQDLSVINISSGINYRILDNETFSWRASIQPGINIITGLESRVRSEYMMDDKLMGNNDNTLHTSTNTNKIFGSINLGIALSYKLSNDYFINVGFGHQRSLTSLRQNTNSKTYLNNWSSYLGISKTF